MSSRAFWQRRCRAAAAGAVLKPQGGNCAVLPIMNNGGGSRCAAQKILGLLCVGNRRQIIERSKPFPIKSQKSPRRGKLLSQRRGGSAFYIMDKRSGIASAFPSQRLPADQPVPQAVINAFLCQQLLVAALILQAGFAQPESHSRCPARLWLRPAAGWAGSSKIPAQC